MLYRLVIFLLLLSCGKLSAQAGQWAWMHSDNFPGGPGSYGTIGVSSPANKPPARYEAAQWTDAQGNFWLYGGGNGTQRFSDLWKFDPLTNEWTWISGSSSLNQPPVYGTQGIPAPGNTPGGLGYAACTWTDNNGNLWLYGGDDGSFGGPWNDLWKYDIATNMWTWVHGNATPGTPPVHGTQGLAAAGNTPGGREETSCTWTDANGNLWLFGGTLSGVGVSCNDLWKYDIAANQWTWMKGSNSPNMPGVYGTQTVSAPANTPGARWCYASWTVNNELWLFGGIDASSPMGMSFFNDLWKYDIATNQWAWMSGPNTPNDPGQYGTKCVPSPNNVPPARGETRSRWTDACGNLWLLGGRDLNFSLYNDLWKYDRALGDWIWVSGDNTPNQNGIYGTITQAASANKPGARMGAVSWTDGDGNFWLFGGYEWGGDQLNDLWRFTPDTTFAAFNASPLSGCAPHTVNFSATSPQGCAGIQTFHWTFGDPASGNADTSALAAPSHTYAQPGTFTATLIIRECSGAQDTASIIIQVTPGLTLSLAGTPSDCQSPSGTASATAAGGTGPYTYNWQPSGGNAATASNLLPGNYTFTVTDNNGCQASDTINVGLSGSIAPALGPDTTVCGMTQLNLSANVSAVTFLWSTGDTASSVSVSQAGTYWVTASTGLCSGSDSITIDLLQAPSANALPTLCDQAEVTIGFSSGNFNYAWSTGDTTPTILVDQPGTYTVSISSGPCVFSDSIIVPAEAGSSVIWFPNSFTPDGNDLNETFRGYGEGVLEFHLMLFDRWGQLIFETYDFNTPWNGYFEGRLVQQDVYVWVADYRLSCADQQRIRRIGHVSVIR